jgi:hypothetical protein
MASQNLLTKITKKLGVTSLRMARKAHYSASILLSESPVMGTKLITHGCTIASYCHQDQKQTRHKNLLLIILDWFKPFYILLLQVDHLAMVSMLSIGQMIAGESRMDRRGQ